EPTDNVRHHAQAGGERKRRAFALSFPRLQEWREATVAAPVRGSWRRPSSAQRRKKRAPVPSPSRCQRRSRRSPADENNLFATPKLNRVSDPNLALEFRPRTVAEYRTSRYSTAL